MKIFRQIVSSFLIFLILMFQGMVYPIIPLITPAYAAINGTFTTNETVANVASSNIPTITFSGGVDAVAATVTVTVPAGLAATATDQTVNIDGVAVPLGAASQTADQVAATIRSTLTSDPGYGAKDYTVSGSNADVTFTKKVAGAAGNGTLTTSDLSYTTTNEVKASRTITVGSVPADAVTLTIGSCVVTFNTVAVQDVDCSDNTAAINTTTDNTATTIATRLRSLSSVSDAAHGALTVGGAGDTASFTTSGSETSATNINASLSAGSTITLDTVNTAGVVLVTSSIPVITFAGGVTAVAASTTISIPAGTSANAADTSVTIDGVTINLGTNQSATQVATTIKNTVFTSGTNYTGNGAYTVNSSGADITFTKSSTGTAGNSSITIADAAYGATAQVVTFTPGGTITAGETYRGTLNGANYDYLVSSGDNTAAIVSSLTTSLDGAGSISCVNTGGAGTSVTCTSDTPGTAFTYAASVIDITAPSAFTAGSVTTSGGTVVSGKWNATNTALSVVVPVANDPTLTGGTIQLQEARNGGSYSNVGSAYTILVGDLNTSKTMNLTESDVEGIAGFANGDTLTFKAVLTDGNTNSTTSSASATSLSVDQSTPTFTAARTGQNTIVLTFNENVTSSDTATAAWTLSTGTVSSVTQPSNSTTLTITTSGISDTSVTPTVTYVAASGTVVDQAGNEVANGANAVAADQAAPILLSARTNSTTTIDLTFSEDLNGTTVTNSDFGVSGYTLTTPDATEVSNGVVRLTVSSAFGTGATPVISYTGSVADLSGNVAANVASMTPSDGVAPTLSSVSLSSNNVLSALFGKVGANVTVSFSASETIATPTVTFSSGGNAVAGSPTITNPSGNSWSAYYVANSSDTEGSVTYSISFTDSAGNAGTAVTSGSGSVTFDKTNPTAPGTPSTTTPTNSTSQTWSWTAGTDALAGVLQYVWSVIDSLAQTVASGTTTSTSVGTSLTEGSYTFSVQTQDYAANLSTSSTGSVTVDTTAPTVTNVSSSLTNGSYKAAQVVPVTVTFSEAVTVTGTPQLTLETGTTDRTVNYTSGSGTTTLTFNYTVQSGDTSSDLDYVGTGSLTLNSGTIQDSAGNNATLTLVTPGASGSLGANKNLVIDTTSPTLSEVTAVTTPGNDTTPNYTFSSSEAGTISYGGDCASATTAASSGSNTITFNTLSEATHSNCTVAVTDAAGNVSSSLSVSSFTIDTTAPTLPSVSISSNNSNTSRAKVGDTVTVTFTSSENIQTPTVTIAGNSASVSGSNTSWAATYTMVSGDTEGSVAFNIAFTDTAGNSGTAVAATTNSSAVTFDKTAPTVSNVTSTSTNATYAVGDTIPVKVTFSENVNVTGTPRLLLETGTTDRYATYVSGSGSTDLIFSYAVQTNDTSSDLDYVSTSSLELNGGTIADAASNNATLTLATPGATGSLGANKALVVSGDSATLSSSTTVSSSTPEVIVNNIGSDATITIPSSVTNATLNLSNLVSGGTATLNNAITLDTSTSIGDVDVMIPAGTITGPSGWNGVLNAPQIQSNTSVSAGGSSTNRSVIEVGANDTEITFSSPVRIFIADQGNIPVGFSRGGTFTEITNVCSSDSSAGIGSFNECKFPSGNNMVIWTKHFTKFVSYLTNAGAGPGGSGATYDPYSAPVCGETKPGGAPSFVSAVAGKNSVTLTWNEAPNPVTYYLITYGETPGTQTYGNANVGGKGTTSYTVNGLSGGKTYYFRIRAGNGCMPGSYSGEISATPGGSELSGPAAGFAQGVLSVAAEKNGDKIEEVKASEDSQTPEEVTQKPQSSNQNNGFLGGLVGAIIGFFTRLFGK